MIKFYFLIVLTFPIAAKAQWQGFSPPLRLTVQDRVNLFHTKDITGDGYPDLTLFYTAMHASFSILKSNGDRQFPSYYNISKSDNYYLSDIADLNGDGYPDMVISSYWNNGFKIYFGSKGGQLKEGPFMATGVHGRNIRCTDINKDGITDIVTTTSGSGRTISLHVFIGNGDGTFHSRKEYPSVLDTCKEIYITDKNGDGLPDVAVSSSFAWLVIFIQKQDGSFEPYYTPTYTTAKLAFADIDADGKEDLISMYPSFENSPGSDSVMVRFNAGGHSFGAKKEVTNFRNRMIRPRIIRVADVNKDGFVDMFFDHTDMDGYSTDTIYYMLGRGNGDFDDPQFIKTPENVLHFELADMDLDGWIDLVVSCSDATMNVFYAKAKGDTKSRTQTNIYPNPARSFLNVESKLQLPFTIRMYTAAGQLVKELVSDTPKKTVQTAGMPSGLYFIQVYNKAETIVRPVVVGR